MKSRLSANGQGTHRKGVFLLGRPNGIRMANSANSPTEFTSDGACDAAKLGLRFVEGALFPKSFVQFLDTVRSAFRPIKRAALGRVRERLAV